MSEKIGQMFVFVKDRNKFTSMSKLEGKTQAEFFREMLERYIELKTKDKGDSDGKLSKSD